MPKQRYTRRPDGRYRVKYKEKYFYGTTISEAQAKRDEYKKQLTAGIRMEKQGITVFQYANEWLPIYKSNVSDKTYDDYANQLSVLIDFLGDMRVADVRPSDAKKVFTHYNGYSDSTIKRARMLFISVFESAIEDGIRHTNPFKSKSAAPHKGTVGTHRAITDEERQLIHQVNHRMRPAIMCMLYAGLRRGEVIALDIDRDVDLKKDTLTVSRSVRYYGNQPILEKRAKTDAGLRTIPVFAQLHQELKGKSGLVLQAVKSGGLMSETAFRRGWDSYMLALSKAAGKKINIRTHDLRHSYCTMLRDAGVDMKLAIQWMGHADEKMILKIYDHVTENRVLYAIDSVEKMLNGGQNGGQKSNKV